MKNKNFLSCVCAVSLVALSLVGCSDYDNGYTEEQLSFIRNFKEIYGNIDETQDWNLAERANVTVTTSSSSDVKIYAKYGGNYTLVGHYSNVSGTKTLGFDVVEGTTDILVSDGSNSVFAKVGESVNLGGTRTVVTDVRDENTEITITYDNNYTIYKNDYIKEVLKKLPEDPQPPKNNLGRVTQDFYFISQGPFTFYPLYWWTDSKNTLGVYWKDKNGKYKLQPVYKAKEGDELAIYDGTKEGDERYDSESPNQYALSTAWKGDVDMAAKGITINLPVGTPFGFYLDVYNGDNYQHTIYSQSLMNKTYALKTPDEMLTATGGWDGRNYTKRVEGADPNNYYDFGATFTAEVSGKTYKFFCFEDWDLNGPDLNDMVFVFGGDHDPVTVDEDASSSWIISAEDLGNTYDIDYNDVVIEVQYVSGESTATVIPLAAGGTLASHVYLNGEPINAENGGDGEIHSLFGASKTTSGQYSPINVDKSLISDEELGTPIPITVDPEKFTLSTTFIEDITSTDNEKMKEIADQNMGGFKIKVLQSKQTDFDEDKAQTIQNSATKGDYNVPFVIVTPKFNPLTGKHYRWPKERVPMFPTEGFTGAAYNETDHSFQAWVTDRSQNDWYKYPNEDMTCAPNQTNGGESGGGGSAEEEPELPTPPNGEEDEEEDETGKNEPTFKLRDNNWASVNEYSVEMLPNGRHSIFLSDQNTNTGGAITYSSNNNDVATVDEWGVITAIAGGNATITVKQASTDTYKSAKCYVYVNVIDLSNFVEVKSHESNSNAFKISDILDQMGSNDQTSIFFETTGTIYYCQTWAADDDGNKAESNYQSYSFVQDTKCIITITRSYLENILQNYNYLYILCGDNNEVTSLKVQTSTSAKRRTL